MNPVISSIVNILATMAALMGQLAAPPLLATTSIPKDIIAGSAVFSPQAGGTIPGAMGTGVGTSTPGAAFAVATSTAGANTAFLLSNAGSGYTAWIEDAANDATPTVIDAAGNMGVGTTTPGSIFSIQGAGNLATAATSTIYSAFATAKLHATSTVMMTGLATESGSGDVLCVNANGQIVKDDSPVTACSGASSRDVKHDIFSLNPKQSLRDILNMRPVSYIYNKDYKPNDQTTHLGFIAEEIDKIDPRLVEYKNGKPEGLKYAEFVAGIVSAMQDQQKEIEALKEEIKRLK